MFDGVHSVRIETEGKFGTNGKGKNKIFALASAYGEFLERLQNNLHTGSTALTRKLYKEIKKKTGFSFFHDEKFMSKE